jgi:hypothetical protein
VLAASGQEEPRAAPISSPSRDEQPRGNRGLRGPGSAANHHVFSVVLAMSS